MDNVISLCDSDSDDDVPQPARPNTVSLESAASASAADVVDLLDDDSSSDEEYSAVQYNAMVMDERMMRTASLTNPTTIRPLDPTRPAALLSAAKARRSAALLDNESSSDEEYATAQYASMVLQEQRAATTRNPATTATTRPQELTTQVAAVVSSTKRSIIAVDLLKDSSDEEYSAVQYNAAARPKSASSAVLVTATKASAAPTAVAARPKTTGHDSDSDDPLLRFESAFARKKRKSTDTALPILDTNIMSSQDSTSSSKIKNPYLKTPPNSQPSPTTPNNPYARFQTLTPGSSSSSTSVVNNPYAKGPPSSQSSVGASTAVASSPLRLNAAPAPPQVLIQYPTLLANSKSYEDLRAKYILAFWKYSKSLVQHSHHRAKLDQTAKKIVALATSEYPIRSMEEYCFRMQGTGGGSSTKVAKDIRDDLQAQLEHYGSLDRFSTPVDACRNGRYYSIAEACLVAIVTQVEKVAASSNPRKSLARLDDTQLTVLLGGKDMWVSLQWLIPEIDQRLQEDCPGKLTRRKDPDLGVAYYMDSSTRSAEYRQLEKLLVPPKDSEIGYLKQHRQKGQLCFELTSLGYATAIRIRQRQFPVAPGHYRSSNLPHVEPKYKDICLGMDIREGGGGHKVLHSMCNKLDMAKIPYFVGSLTIGDYAFFSGGRLCPILVERKSIQDIAGSIFDGRWESQKKRMYHGQYVFGYDNSRIAFIVEGKEETQQVTGGYIAHRKFNVDRKRLDEEIENLQKEGFEVLRTTSPENSMFELSRWAQRVGEDVRSGKLKIQYTYEQFKQEVRKIPPHTDFSRIAKDSMATRLENAQCEPSAKRSYDEIGNDDDSDIEVLEPSKLTYEKERTRGDTVDKRNGPTGRPPKESIRPGSEPPEGKDYSELTTSELQNKCVEYGLTKTGTRDALMARLHGPRPPKLWLLRKQKKQYVPARHDCGATALLVAMYILEKDASENNNGMTKDEIYMKAEELEITKNPFSGGTTQTGPYHYDGWTNMSKLTSGDPALVIKRKNRFKLTRSCEIAGYPLAQELHRWCHEWDSCSCRDR